MDGLGAGLAALDAVLHEVMLIAAAGFLMGGVDDLAVDFAYLIHRLGPWSARAKPAADGARQRLVIFVAAWRESAVIEHMLRTALARLGPGPLDILVGCYPNDPTTGAAVARVAADDRRVHRVTGRREGPTTKADNLNTLWHALGRIEAAEGFRAAAVIIHDAEDVVHPDELDLFADLIRHYDLVQLPVLPLVAKGSRLVSGHYADEFAESHAKSLVVREAIGAALPLAGTGCAISRDMLERLAEARGGAPFDESSLTEDYELGLQVRGLAGRATFARRRGHDGSLVAVRAYFPAEFGAAVRQKARWMTGIALAGWDRVGWDHWYAIADHWMRARDRRALFAVVVTFAGWLSLLLFAVSAGLHLAIGHAAPAFGNWTRLLLTVNGVLLGWRAAVRALFTGRVYGLAEALLAPPRMLVGNAILLCAARRAMATYLDILRGRAVVWAKTDHVFPEQLD